MLVLILVGMRACGLSGKHFALHGCSPEDVFRCKFGKRLAPVAIQLLRDFEAVWGLRSMIRRVEALIAAPAQQSEDGSGVAGGDGNDDDNHDEAALAMCRSRSQSVAAAASEDELVLSCRCVGFGGLARLCDVDYG